MKYLMSILAIVMFSFAIAGCETASNACLELCDKADECAGTDTATTCREAWAQTAPSEEQITACQTALDAYADVCGSDDDDSAS